MSEETWGQPSTGRDMEPQRRLGEAFWEPRFIPLLVRISCELRGGRAPNGIQLGGSASVYL